MTLHELVGALGILAILIYAYGFMFFLGLWLEDDEGRSFSAPFIAAVFWPVVLFPVSFGLGVILAKWFRRFNKVAP